MVRVFKNSGVGSYIVLFNTASIIFIRNDLMWWGPAYEVEKLLASGSVELEKEELGGFIRVWGDILVDFAS